MLPYLTVGDLTGKTNGDVVLVRESLIRQSVFSIFTHSSNNLIRYLRPGMLLASQDFFRLRIRSVSYPPRRSPFLCPVVIVLLSCPQKEVFRIAASRTVTAMADAIFSRIFSAVFTVQYSTSLICFFVYDKFAVSLSINGFCPGPATIIIKSLIRLIKSLCLTFAQYRQYAMLSHYAFSLLSHYTLSAENCKRLLHRHCHGFGRRNAPIMVNLARAILGLPNAPIHESEAGAMYIAIWGYRGSWGRTVAHRAYQGVWLWA